MTLQERIKERGKTTRRLCRYYGKEHDLYIELSDYSRLQSNFAIEFDAYGKRPPVIMLFRKNNTTKYYKLDSPPLLCEDNGYYCIHAKRKGNHGIHKVPIHRLAYIAYYGEIKPGYHIHHIDRNKHNNSAANLVALTEEEHTAVHGHSTAVGKSLFTPKTKSGLLTMTTKDVPRTLEIPKEQEAGKRLPASIALQLLIGDADAVAKEVLEDKELEGTPLQMICRAYLIRDLG